MAVTSYSLARTGRRIVTTWSGNSAQIRLMNPDRSLGISFPLFYDLGALVLMEAVLAVRAEELPVGMP